MTNETMNYDAAEAIQRKKIKIGQRIALGVIALYVILGILIINQNAVILPVLMGAIVFLFAPVTAFFYIREVKRGVFKTSPEEDS